MLTSAARTRLFAIFIPIATIALCLGMMEIGLRLAISDVFKVSKLRQPRLYTDPWLDDDYYKLTFLWERRHDGKDEPEPGLVRYDVDPLLGWAPKPTKENPLGIVTDMPYNADESGPSILFFGDSMVDGPEPIPNKLPQLLGQLVHGRKVLNYGVNGYGVDQIYLRFLETGKKYHDPIVLVGILDRDLDRTILSFRGGQKPVLSIENGELHVGNLPILDPAEYLRRNPVTIHSYLLRFILLRARPLGGEGLVNRVLGYDQRQELLLRLNRRILEALKEQATSSRMHLYVVLFYAEADMSEKNWREVFLKDSLGELGLPYFDTKTYLLSLIAARGGTIHDYYSPQTGHPNRAGNLAFAQGIAAWLDSMTAAN